MVKRYGDGLYDYIDTIGRKVIPCQYEDAWGFDDKGYASVGLYVKEKGKRGGRGSIFYGCIATDGSIQIPLMFGGRLSKRYRKIEFREVNGRDVSIANYFDTNEDGLINRKGNWIVSPKDIKHQCDLIFWDGKRGKYRGYFQYP